jgi:DNA-binding CsgD family transcriptional regulator
VLDSHNVDLTFDALTPASLDSGGVAAWVHALWFTGNTKLFQSTIDSIQRTPVKHQPALTMLRGQALLRNGDIPGGLALLRKASRLSESSERDYYIDVLVPLALGNQGPCAADEELDAVNGAVPELRANLLAIRSAVAAFHGARAESRRLAQEALDILSPDASHHRALVLQRLALAAFHRYELEVAQTYASEALCVATQVGMNRIASTCCSVLYAITTNKAHYTKDETGHGWLYAQEHAELAAMINDRYQEQYALTCLLDLAAEGGNEEGYVTIKRRLSRARGVPEFKDTRFAARLADVLYFGWNRRFEDARIALERLLTALDESVDYAGGHAARCLCLALLGAALLGLDDPAGCRRFARRAISESRRPAHTYERPQQAAWRERGRIVAVATCVAVGDTTRAKRSISAEYRLHADFFNAFARPPIDLTSVSPSLRGYARFVASAQQEFLRQNPADLTPAEAKVMSALLDGMTPAEIARHLDKAPSTVKMQLRSAYQRLGAENRLDAIRRARELGLQPSVV